MFKDPVGHPDQPNMGPERSGRAAEWSIGQVPALGSDTDGINRSSDQLIYARKLLGVIAEVSIQFVQVVENLEQIYAQADESNAGISHGADHSFSGREPINAVQIAAAQTRESECLRLLADSDLAREQGDDWPAHLTQPVLTALSERTT